MMTMADVTLAEFTRVGNAEGISNNDNLKAMWEVRPMSEEYDEEILRHTFQHCKPKMDSGECKMECVERVRAEMSEEDIDAIADAGIEKAKALKVWESEHQEEATVIVHNAAGVLATLSASFEAQFPLIRLCPDKVFMGLMEATYLAGHLNGAEILKLDELTK